MVITPIASHIGAFKGSPYYRLYYEEVLNSQPSLRPDPGTSMKMVKMQCEPRFTRCFGVTALGLGLWDLGFRGLEYIGV